MSDLVPGLPYADFVREARRHLHEASFRNSDFFRLHAQALEALLHTPQISGRYGLPPAGRDRLAVVHWNIEKGKQLSGLRQRFALDPDLQQADLVFLNEVDVGMARAGSNADVGRELAEAWGGHLVYLPSYIECTKGLGDERLVDGENSRGLHGLALLSRLPVVEARMFPLPACWDYFDFEEKRLGFRQGLYVLLDWHGVPVVAATTHLEVRRTPAGRQIQAEAFFRGLAAALKRWGSDLPVVIAGDWNTNTFARSGWWNTLRGFVRIVSTPPERLARELRAPFDREPLFDNLRWERFDWQPFNDDSPTASQRLGTVEDLSLLPPALAEAVVRAFQVKDRVLEMRLDWIAGRGVVAAGAPRTLSPGSWSPQSDRVEGSALSDHAPILAFVRLP
ncbi:MAG: endonuclease/exonuclease/phosphatase family protein [Candidatus Eisenbacteria bacterium]|nr:endonuclease/exonuclease/phosphatase family protein [Candidatus Eisenbacteria bacterium]